MIYLNGEFMPIEEARIPVLDRGFIFGDGVYEVIPVYSRRPFRLAEHLNRLQDSLNGIRITNPHTDAEWGSLLSRISQDLNRWKTNVRVPSCGARGGEYRQHFWPDLG